MDQKARYRVGMTGRRFRQWYSLRRKNAKESAAMDYPSQRSHGSEYVPSGHDEDGSTSTSSSSAISDDERMPNNKKRKISSILERDLNKSNHREKIAHCIEDDDFKSNTTKFVLYLVPVSLSNLQTELYCFSLFSNATILCSSTQHLPGGLYDILLSTAKCCDHPYLVDRTLHTSLIQGIPITKQLDVEIMCSGKLLLFYKILEEIKRRGLRVLVLYQTLRGSGPVSTGDILDDMIHEKFGKDSFIRIEGEIHSCNRKDVLNSFNDKESGKFACLIETQACVPSIELASIDTVVLFNSVWDSLDDLKALQKVNLTSQFEQVKVFRLYSLHTVEEKALDIALKGNTVVGNARYPTRSTCHELLRWGASYLFKKLDEFNSSNTPGTYSVISGDSYVEDVFREVSTSLPNNIKSNTLDDSQLSKVKRVSGICNRGISLIGKTECPLEELMNKLPSQVFWKNLLEGRKPRWNFFSSHPSRTRNKFKRDIERNLSGEYPRGKRKSSPVRHNSKDNAVESHRRDATACFNPSYTNAILTGEHINMDGICSTELLSQVPHDKHDHLPSFPTIQTDLAHGTPGYSSRADAACESAQLTADSLSPLDSSGQHYMEEVPLSTAPIIASHMTAYERETSALVPFLNSGNHLPVDASHVTYSVSVCAILKTELEKLQKQENECLKLHEEMKVQTKLALEEEINEVCKKWEEEINEVRKKCDKLLLNDEITFLRESEVRKARSDILYAQTCLASALMQQDNSGITSLFQGNEMYMEVVPQTGLTGSTSMKLTNFTGTGVGFGFEVGWGFGGVPLNLMGLGATRNREVRMNPTSIPFSGSLTGPVNPRPDLQLQMVINQVGSRRAPAPHLRRYVTHSSHVTVSATRLSSPGTDMFTPVLLSTQPRYPQARLPLLRN